MALIDDSQLPGGVLVDVHCHSLGGIDFSEVRTVDLDSIQDECEVWRIQVIPTIFLRRETLGDFLALMLDFHERKNRGQLSGILGFALEGPLLASHGGTPGDTAWRPTLAEWEILANEGQHGLLYMVLSADAFMDPTLFPEDGPEPESDMATIIPLLARNRVRPALGHFSRSDPARTALAIQEVVELAHLNWHGPGAPAITDHLFNDMPLLVPHAFRTEEERATRDRVVASLDLDDWNLSDLPNQVGVVPAALIRLAYAGKIAVCINFDGDHVDLEIAARAVGLMGVDNVMVMTDFNDAPTLGGQELHRIPENSLWYQSQDIVAAGTTGMEQQARNLCALGFSNAEVATLTRGTALRVFRS
jgi:N-acetylglucosamine-6-phosphate deacetylase